MNWSQQDFIALRTLIREELSMQLVPFRAEINARFNQVGTQLDGLYKKDEAREQEYVFIKKQIERLQPNK